MQQPRDYRLAELFVRYWDNSATIHELGELHTRLADDPTARDEFQLYCLQAVCVGEHAGIAVPEAGAPQAQLPDRRTWSRRRVLGLLGGGVAAGLMATAVGRYLWPTTDMATVRLKSIQGDVNVRTPERELVVVNGVVPPGGVVTTIGPTSSAVLTYADGTDIALAGDSALSVSAEGRKLSILRGTATAHVPRHTDNNDEQLTLLTPEVIVSRLSGAVLTLGRAMNSTEVGVQSGRVAVAGTDGEPLEIVHGGEYMTVRSDGFYHKKPIEPTPNQFFWDLSKPLPEGWSVGTRETADDRPIVRPVLWFDPYHKAPMFQIRSDKQWARGFVRLQPGSTFRIRYWIDRPGPSQFCLCVRTDSSSRSDTGMLECNDAFQHAKIGQWQTLEVRAGDMLNNKHTPKFDAPWVAFLFIFNSYTEDLGLRIADVRVV